MKGRTVFAALLAEICVATVFGAVLRAADEKAENPKPATTEKQRGEGRGPRDSGAWGCHPWHDQWHQGYWAGADWGSGNTWRWGWSGPWAWGFSGPGPGADTYDNPFCGKCQPIVLREVYGRSRGSTFTFGGGLSRPNEGGGDDYQEYQVVIDYSQPLAAAVHVDPSTTGSYPDGAPLVSEGARIALSSAREAFYRADYNVALQYVNSALIRMPRDPAIHEFRAQVLFALARYGDSATTLNAVLAVGPGWNWRTMSRLYPNVGVYTSQLRALEAYSKKNPQAADGHFLLAYHYLTDGYPESAVKQLQQVVEVEPRASVAAHLLQQLAPAAEPERAQPAPSPEDGQADPEVAVDGSRFLGTWKRALADRTTFTMTLEPNSNFTWSFTRQGKSTRMSGINTLGRDTLLLEDAHGAMLAQVSFAADGALNFKVAGTPAGQGEIVFRR
jgi:hypothetical protein